MNKQTKIWVLTITASVLILAGCQQNGDHAADHAEAAGAHAEETADHAMPAGEHVHNLRCGCVVEGVGECGNFIEVEGEYVELVLPDETDAELGEMPFCGETELMANVDGEVVDGRFIATSFEYVER